MNEIFKIPFFIKISLLSIGLLAFVSMLYFAQGIIIPIIYATIIGIVLSPIVNFLVAKKMNRVIAILITVTLMVAAVFTLVTLLVSQASLFSQSFPALIAKFDLLIHDTERWVSGRFNISLSNVHKWVDQTSAEIQVSSRSLLGQTLANIGSLLIVLVLIPVYIFMILFYQPLLIEFIHRLFSNNASGTVNEVLASAKKIIQSYLAGLLLEALIIAVMNVATLLILGIEYAILLGVIGAIVNVIPYLGGIIAVALPMLIAFATKSPGSALLVLVAYIIIQFIDNHIIIPNIVASKVKINALISIIVVLCGGALWGIPGMFLSIPLTAIVKVIFDHVESMKPWGYLLGNAFELPERSFFFRNSQILINHFKKTH